MRYCIPCKTEPDKNDAKYASFGVCNRCHIKINKRIDEERFVQSILITAEEEFAETTLESQRFGQYKHPLSKELILPPHMQPDYKTKAKEPKRRHSISFLVDSAGKIDDGKKWDAKNKKWIDRPGDDETDWKTWYENNDKIIEQIFGADADLFKSLLVANSPLSTIKSNVTKALTNYNQIMRGEKITGMKTVVKNVERLLKGEPISGKKVFPFELNMFGDLMAVTADMHIFELLYGKYDREKGKWYASKGLQSSVPSTFYVDEMIKKVADKLGWTPSQAQAALWTFNIELRGETPHSYSNVLEYQANNVFKARGSEQQPLLESIPELQEEFGGEYVERQEGGYERPEFGGGSEQGDPGEAGQFGPGQNFLDRIEERSEQGQGKKRPGSDPLDFHPLNPE